MDFERITEAEAKAMIVAERKVKIRRFRALMVLVIMGSLYAFVGLAGIMSRDMYALLMQPKIVWIFIVMPVAVVVWGFWPRATVTVSTETEPTVNQSSSGGSKKELSEMESASRDEMSSVESWLTRYSVWFAFHFGLYIAGNFFMDYFLYQPYGRDHSFIEFCLRTVGWTGLVVSATWESFDLNTVKLNQRAAILWNEKYVCSASGGIFCRGLPEWFLSDFKVIDLESHNILFGIVKKDDSREHFIIECQGFKVILDIAFEVMASPRWIKRILLIGGNADEKQWKAVEKRLVQDMNAVIFDICNEYIERDGVKTYLYPNIDAIKNSTAHISDMVMRGVSRVKNKDIHNSFARWGYVLRSVTVKDAENSDSTFIIKMQKAYADKAAWNVTVEKAEDLVRKSQGEMTLRDALNMILADEGDVQRQSLVMEQSGDSQSQGKGKRKGGGRGSSPAITPVIMMQTPPQSHQSSTPPSP